MADIELVIKIPKETFELLKSGTQIDFLDAMHIISTIQNGIPLEDELENIKREIKDLDLGFFDEDYRAGVARGMMEFNKILNNRIAELEGE